jgi:hypothetical protein
VTVIDPLAKAKKIAEERAKQDEQDIDRIVPACAQLIRSDYSNPNVENFLIQVYPDGGGLEAILRTHFLQQVANGMVGETLLCRMREVVKAKLNEEVERARRANPKMTMSQLLTVIDSWSWCFIKNTKTDMERAHQTLGQLNSSIVLARAKRIMNNVARIVYYYEFKNSLLRNEE